MTNQLQPLKAFSQNYGQCFPSVITRAQNNCLTKPRLQIQFELCMWKAKINEFPPIAYIPPMSADWPCVVSLRKCNSPLFRRSEIRWVLKSQRWSARFSTRMIWVSCKLQWSCEALNGELVWGECIRTCSTGCGWNALCRPSKYTSKCKPFKFKFKRIH